MIAALIVRYILRFAPTMLYIDHQGTVLWCTYVLFIVFYYNSARLYVQPTHLMSTIWYTYSFCLQCRYSVALHMSLTENASQMHVKT